MTFLKQYTGDILLVTILDKLLLWTEHLKDTFLDLSSTPLQTSPSILHASSSVPLADNATILSSTFVAQTLDPSLATTVTTTTIQ